MIATESSKLEQTPLAEFIQAARGYELPIPLGTDQQGELVVKCLAQENSHLLVAGLTRSGKSRHIHATIQTISATRTPEEVEFLIIDLKGGIDFGQYDLKHCVLPPVTESSKVYGALGWLLEYEGNNRQALLKSAGCTDIKSYNECQKLDGKPPLPRQLLIIDEVHLISKDAERTLMELLSVGLSWGLHVILGTQRPCSKNLESRIKANMRGRISYQTVDKSNARIIQIDVGAEKLLPRELIAEFNSYSGTLTAPLVTDEDIKKGRTLGLESSLSTKRCNNAMPKHVTCQEYLESTKSLREPEATVRKSKNCHKTTLYEITELLDGVIKPLEIYNEEKIFLRPTLILKNTWWRCCAVDVMTGRFLTKKYASRAILASLCQIKETSWAVLQKITRGEQLSSLEIGIAHKLIKLGVVHGAYNNVSLNPALISPPLIKIQNHVKSTGMRLSLELSTKVKFLRGAMARLYMYSYRKQNELILGLPYYKDKSGFRAAWNTRYNIRFEEGE